MEEEARFLGRQIHCNNLALSKLHSKNWFIPAQKLDVASSRGTQNVEQGFESQYHIPSVMQAILMDFDMCLEIHKHEGVKTWLKHMTMSKENKFSLN